MEHDVEKLTGITNEMLEGAPDISKAMKQFAQCYPLDPIVFYYGECDESFLHTALIKTGIPFDEQRPRIDLMYLAVRLYMAHCVKSIPKLSAITKLIPEAEMLDPGNDIDVIANLLIFFLRKLRNEYGFYRVDDLF